MTFFIAELDGLHVGKVITSLSFRLCPKGNVVGLAFFQLESQGNRGVTFERYGLKAGGVLFYDCTVAGIINGVEEFQVLVHHGCTGGKVQTGGQGYFLLFIHWHFGHLFVGSSARCQQAGYCYG